jgi:hypothetical protein
MLIDMLELLPEKIYVKLEENFRKELFDKCIVKAGTVTRLAKMTKVSRQWFNKWRWGWQRTPFDAFTFLLNYNGISIHAVWDNIEEFGLQGQNRGLKLPRFFNITEDFIWFIGVRHGDKAESKTQIGLCNSDTDILKKFCEVLFLFGIPSETLSFYVYVKDEEKRKILKTFLKNLCKAEEKKIKFYYRSDREMYVIVQLHNALFHKLVYKIEENLPSLLSSSSNFKAAYIRGFADAEGCVDHHGYIIITQKLSKLGKKNIQLVMNLLEKLCIKSHTRTDGLKLRLIINRQSLKSYEHLIGFCSKRKMNDLKIIREIYENKYDKRNIENEITELAQKPITRREIVLALKSNYDKTGLVIRKLAKEGKINVINKRPLTIISLKEVPHDSLVNHP